MSSHQEDEPVAWYIGQHERNRKYHVSRDILQLAHDKNVQKIALPCLCYRADFNIQYDLLTARITNDNYSARVLSQLTAHMQSLGSTSNESQDEASPVPAPIIRPLTMADTSLSSDDAASSLLLLTSQWIDLASPDLLIADLSRQVLVQEVSFAAFCGATNIIIRGPDVSDGCTHSEDNIARFAHAVEEVLRLGIYLNLHILLPMSPQSDSDLEHDVGHLSNFASNRPRKQGHGSTTIDALASWDAWNIIRNVCRYSSRLSVGKNEFLLIILTSQPSLHT